MRNNWAPNDNRLFVPQFTFSGYEIPFHFLGSLSKCTLFPHIIWLPSLKHQLVLWLWVWYLNCLILSFLFYKMGIKVVPTHKHHKSMSICLLNIRILFDLYLSLFNLYWDFLEEKGTSLVAQSVKNPPAIQETQVQSLGWEDPLEKGMATHSSILPWRIPWTEEPGRLQSMGSQESLMTKPPSTTGIFKDLFLFSIYNVCISCWFHYSILIPH